MKRKRLSLLLVAVLLVLLPSTGHRAHAQDNPSCLSNADINSIFQDINRFRTGGEIAPFRINEDLCTIAVQHAIDVATRTNTQYSFEQRSDGTTRNDWLEAAGFPAYNPNEYAVAFRVFATQVYTPDEVIAYLIEHERENYEFALRDRRFREIGIGYAYNADQRIHYYVFMAGSRPNILPITIVVPSTPFVQAETVSSARVQIWLSNESYQSEGNPDGIIGTVRAVRASEFPEEQPCPTGTPSGEWQLFNSRVDYVIDGGIDLHTIYVQLCDAVGDLRTIVESAQVYLADDSRPVAQFQASAVEGVAPLGISFNDTSRGIVRAYQWDFNGDGLADSVEQEPHFTFTEPGVYVVRLTVVGNSNFTDTSEMTVTVNAPVGAPLPPPTATIEFQQSGTNPLEYTFRAVSAPDEVNSYTWDLNGDGLADGVGESITYMFPGSGNYIIRLTATGPGGATPAETSVTVSQPVPAPEASFTFDLPANNTAPVLVTFTSTSIGMITELSWDLNGDNQPDYLGYQAQVQRTYDVPGTFTVTLTVTGPGGTDIIQQALVINPVPPPLPTEAPQRPEACINARPLQGNAPMSVTFASCSEGEITEIAWDIGEDQVIESTENPFNYTFPDPGEHVVLLNVTGPSGSDRERVTVIVEVPPPPTAIPSPANVAFQADVTSGVAPLTVTFSNSTTGGVSEFLWDLDGNGFTDQVTQQVSQVVSQTYTMPGLYMVRLAVVGAEGSAPATVTINVFGPTATNTPTPTQAAPTPTATETPTIATSTATAWMPASTPTMTTETPTPTEMTPTSTPVTPSPSPTLPLLIGEIELIWEADILVITNVAQNDLRSEALTQISFTQGGSSVSINWNQMLENNFSRIPPRHCVIIYNNLSTETLNFEPAIQSADCVRLEGYVSFNGNFWHGGAFEVICGGSAIQTCQSGDGLCELMLGGEAPVPPVALLPTATETPTLTPTATFTPLPTLAPSPTATPQETVGLSLYWTEDYFILRSESEHEISTEQILHLGFGQDGRVAFPNAAVTWTSAYTFPLMRRGDCIILMSQDMPHYIDYTEGYNAMICSQRTTDLTTVPFWQNTPLQAFVDGSQFAECPSGELPCRCSINMPLR